MSLTTASNAVSHAGSGQERHALLPAPGGTNRLMEFFRYHGIWAPGIRLFRALGFKSKAVVISLTFMLPIVWLAGAYYIEKGAAIAFSAKERVGVAYAKGAMPLMAALLDQRQAALHEALRERPAANAEQVREAVETGFRQLAETEAAHGAQLGTAAAYAALLEQARKLPQSDVGVEPLLQAHRLLLQRFVELLTTSTDNSNLTLDPDLDSYYLMDGSLAVMPQLLEATALLRDKSAAILQGHAPSAEYSKSLHAIEAMGDLSDERWLAGMQKVATLHPNIGETIGLEKVRADLHAFHDLVDATESVARLNTAGTAVLADLFSAQQKMLEQLDDLLIQRVAALEARRWLTTAVLVFGLIGAWYLFICFRKVLDGGLREVALHINAMRDGDLTTCPRAWGADEVARLMQTLTEMQTSLRRIVGRVRSASDSIVHAAQEISSASSDLSARTEHSAANLEETASAMEQLAATVRHNEGNVAEAARLAESNAGTAEQGGLIIREVVQTMQGLQQSSDRIGQIIGTIDGIAFQTNILALNAAVEAARAGEQGRGFAVVASEVRALAQRSATAAREIKQLIGASIEQTAASTRVVQQAGGTIEDIVSSARRVRELLADVSTGAREQSAGIGQTALAVQDLDTATQQNAALVEQTAAAAASLNDQAIGLAGEVEQFRLP